ncbi:MAG: cyclic peptide export ABC transporter [Bacteroidota bacterium]
MKFARKIFLYAILGIVAGLAGFLFIVLVNTVIDLLITDSLPEEHHFGWLFLGVIAAFFITRRCLSQGIIELSQHVFWSIRKEMVEAIIKAPYLTVRALKEEIYSALTTDVNNITNASLVVIRVLSSIILVIACFVYLGYLSLPLFLLSIACIGMGIAVYLRSASISHAQFAAVRELEQGFMKGFNDLLEGNKEIKINPGKGRDLLSSILLPIIAEGKKRNVRAYIGYLNSQLISQLLFYCLIAVILVAVGKHLVIELGTIVSFVFALLYLLGPIVNIMLNIPVLNRALISYKKLNGIKEQLQVSGKESEEDKLELLGRENAFEAMAFQGYEYSYPDGSFSIGPIHLSVKANEIIFIYGGNGSGKTTFVNAILSLYTPQKGSLLVNGQRIGEEQLTQTRALFSPVFSDFHLFDDFYGIESIDAQRVRELLVLFEIDHKVSFKEGQLSTTDLSTGQRKRLALIAAILEDRPILVLDEWAADQDPYFRRKFYAEIIHRIVKEENKTIIAITHDDLYYQEADRLFKMNYGQLEEITTDARQVNQPTP